MQILHICFLKNLQNLHIFVAYNVFGNLGFSAFFLFLSVVLFFSVYLCNRKGEAKAR